MPPTSGGAVPPSPFAPWHFAPRRAKSSSPCWTLPLPGGSPVPSGLTSMSQPAICSAPAGSPKPNRASGVLTAHLPAGGHDPGLDPVEVVEGIDPPRLDQLVLRRLDVASLVDRAAGDPRRVP